MANIPKRITDLSLVAGTSIASDDSFPFVDASDTTDGTAGTTKRVAGSAFLFQNNGTVSQNTVFSGSVGVSGSATFSGTARFTGNNNFFANNVGFGTSAPAVRVHTFTSSDEHIRMEHSGTAGNPYLTFFQAGTRRALFQFVTTNNTIFFTSEYGDVAFKAAATQGVDSDTEYMRIVAGGSVGIGTAVPTARLDVAGTIQADGLRIDQAPTSGAVTTTHYLSVNLNGTTYRIPVGTA